VSPPRPSRSPLLAHLDLGYCLASCVSCHTHTERVSIHGTAKGRCTRFYAASLSRVDEWGTDQRQGQPSCDTVIVSFVKRVVHVLAIYSLSSLAYKEKGKGKRERGERLLSSLLIRLLIGLLIGHLVRFLVGFLVRFLVRFLVGLLTGLRRHRFDASLDQTVVSWEWSRAEYHGCVPPRSFQCPHNSATGRSA
jgi:hypothetical protein